jgi:DNA processing protein
MHEKHRIKTLCATDSPYSHIFTRDANVPLVLYYRGRIAQPEVPITGIIGSRACSSYGREVTKAAVYQALSRKEIIASGLSFGTDALAHETTLSHQGLTYAFLPCGLHRTQPVAHTALCEKIEEHGAVITPFAYGKEALPFRFIERNELLVAWCDTLLVVEARMKSPCMNTARIALSHGKRVFAVPHSLLEPRSEGTNHLLAQGAQVYLNDALLENPGMHPALDATHQEQGQKIITVLNDKPLGTGELVSLVGQETSLVMENLAAMEVADQVEYRSDGKWHWVGGP